MKALFFLFLLIAPALADDSIIRHFRHQETEGSCSLATATVVLNALKGADSDLSEQEVLALSKSSDWAKAILDDGDGLTLPMMEAELKNLLLQAGLGNHRVEAFHLEGEEATLRWEETLALLAEKKVYVILNFDQAIILGMEGPFGHFSPVGSYDPRAKSVLVLDTYSPMGRPYWVGLSTLEKSMRAPDTETKRPRGFIRVFKAL